MSECIAESGLPVHYSAKFRGSFAYLTVKDRLPVILVKVVDSLCQEKHSIGLIYGEAAKKEEKEIIGRLSALQNEMVTNKPIKPLVSDGSDVRIWNDCLKLQNDLFGFPPAWFDSSWLYVECYLYRRMKEAFELSSMLKDYDFFHKQKEESFLLSMDAVTILCDTLNQTISELQNAKNEAEIWSYFKQYLEVSLWGNKCDLSLTAGKENIQMSSPFLQLDDLRANVLINDSETVWQILLDANKISNEVQIDFVLDNAGFELFCDLCFLHFLQASKLVKRIRLYVKKIPWFVSDALEKDVSWLLDTLLQSEQEILVNYSKEWSAKIADGQWMIEEETFWTLPHDYSEMQSIDPQLYGKLSESELIFFKGDLNYRKLSGDRQWDEVTSFKTALNGFQPTSLVSLRTIKADVIVGLKSGTTENMNKLSQNWKFSGDFAVIQCARS